MCVTPQTNNQKNLGIATAPSSQGPIPAVEMAPAAPSNAGPDPFDYSEKYNTKLTPNEEVKFQEWAEKNKRTKDAYDYDIKGAWKELSTGKMKEADNGHLGDKYKKPNHPTFSNQSVYSGKEGIKGGTWGREGGKDTFTPSRNHLWSPEDLQKYFKDREPNAILKR